MNPLPIAPDILAEALKDLPRMDQLAVFFNGGDKNRELALKAADENRIQWEKAK